MSNSSWLSVSSTHGAAGTTRVNVTAEKNTTTLKRTGVITATTSRGESAKLICTQSPQISYVHGAASFYDGSIYTGGMLPDACIKCNKCMNNDTWNKLSASCPTAAFSINKGYEPAPGDIIFDPNACAGCYACPNVWSDNANCPKGIKLVMAP